MTRDEYEAKGKTILREYHEQVNAALPAAKQTYFCLRPFISDYEAKCEILFWEGARAGLPELQWAIDRIGGLDRIPSDATIWADHHA